MLNIFPARDDAVLSFVVFWAGGCRFGIETSQVQGAELSMDSSLPPAELLLGLPREQSGKARQILMVRGQAGSQFLCVGPPVEIRTFSAADIYPLPALVAARCQLPALLGLALAPDGLICLLDLRELLPEWLTERS